MARLPAIPWRTGTPTLGRHNTSLPAARLRAKTKLYNAVAGTIIENVEARMEEDLSAAVASAQGELQVLRGNLTTQKNYDTGVTDLGEFRYKRTDEAGNERRHIPAHEVMDQAWSSGVKDIMERHGKGLSRGQRRKLEQKTRSSIASMGNDVRAKQMEWRTDWHNARINEAAGRLINSATAANQENVKMQVVSMYSGLVRQGLMGAEEAVNKMRKARQDIDFHVVMRGIQEGRPGELEYIEDQLTLGPEQGGFELSLAQQRQAFVTLDRIRDKRERERSKLDRENRRASAINAFGAVHEDGHIEWDQARAMALNMEPADAKAFLSLNAAKLREETGELRQSNEPFKKHIQGEISMLEFPLPGQTTHGQAALLQMQIREALESEDPNTRLSADDAAQFLTRIRGARQQLYSDPRVEDGLDTIARITMGMGKDAFSMSGNAPGTANYVRAKEAYYKAVREQGAMFDPYLWLEENRDIIVSINAEKAIQKGLESIYKAHLPRGLRSVYQMTPADWTAMDDQVLNGSGTLKFKSDYVEWKKAAQEQQSRARALQATP